MAWFVLARALFIGAVAYSAVALQPLGSVLLVNLAFGAVLAALVVVFEWRLRTTSVTHMLGAMLGGAVGLLVARVFGAALFWANPVDHRVAFLHAFILLVFPYIGLLVGGSLSNLVDRIRVGHVTDFIDVSHWPSFNLADSFIVVGVAILLAALVVSDRTPRPPRRRPLDVAAR